MSTEPPPGAPGTPTGDPSQFSDFFHTDELPAATVPARSHRGERDLGPLSRRVLAPLTAVVVVVVVILLLIWINGKSPGTGPGPGVIAGPTGSSAHRHHTTGPHHRPTTRTTPRATASASSPHTATPTATPTAPPSSSAVPGAGEHRTAMAPVQVLNNSTISGLAARVAGELDGKGWRVSGVGNLQGVVPVTTVYFARGQRAAAEHLKREFPSIGRVLPAGAGHVQPPSQGLTLVLTRDWSG